MKSWAGIEEGKAGRSVCCVMQSVRVLVMCLNSKVKLSLYGTFGKIVEFKKYLRGVGDAGTRLLFKFRSGTHGLNEELGRHRGREGRKECLLCDAECESVSRVLWDCPAYTSIRSAFMLELRRELGDRFEHFQSLDSFEKLSYVLGSEAWEEYSSGLLGLIKDFVLSVWEERKVRLYGKHTNVHQNDSWDLRGVAGGDGELGCLCGKAGTSHLCDGSGHSSGCVVNGSNAMAAFCIIRAHREPLSPTSEGINYLKDN